MRRAAEWKPLFVVLVPGSLCNSTRSFHFTARSFRLSRRGERETSLALAWFRAKRAKGTHVAGGTNARAAAFEIGKRSLSPPRRAIAASALSHRFLSALRACGCARVLPRARHAGRQATLAVRAVSGGVDIYAPPRAAGISRSFILSFHFSLLVRWFSFTSLFVLCTYVLAASSFRVT